MRRVNVRFVAILAIIVFFLGAGVLGLYWFQVSRHAQFFRDQARVMAEEARDRKEEAGFKAAQETFVQAVSFYNRYLSFYRDDVEALAELGSLYADFGVSHEAFFTFEKVLRLEPNRPGIRRKAVLAAMDLGRARDARDHLEVLLVDSPDDPELLDMLGQCQKFDGDGEDAVESFEKAIKNGSKQYDTYRRLAELSVTDLKSIEKADEYMLKLAEDNPQSAEAFTVRGRFHLWFADQSDTKENERRKRAELALEDAKKAIELAPDDEEALTLGATAANRTEDDESALQYGNRLIELFPNRATGYLALAEAEQRRGNREESIAWLRKGLVPTDESLSLLWALSQYLIEEKRFDDAQETLDRIKIRNFEEEDMRIRSYTDSRLKHAAAFMEAMKGNWKIALEMFEANQSAVQDDPSLVRQAKYWISRCYAELGQQNRSLAEMGQALRETEAGRAHYARSLAAAGRIDDALNEWQQMLATGDAPKGALLEVARLLIIRNQSLAEGEQDWDQVFRFLDRAEANDPDRYQIASLRAEAFRLTGDIAQARKTLEDAVAQSPDEFGLRNAQITLEITEKNWDKADQLFQKLTADLGDSASVRVLRARYLVARYGKDSAEKLRALEQGTEAFSAEDREKVLSGIAGAARQAGDFEYAESLFKRLAEGKPQDLSTQLVLFELAIQNGDKAAVESHLNRIREIEGNGPYWHYGTALLLVTEYHRAGGAATPPGQTGPAAQEPGKERDTKALRDALAHLTEAMVQRPNWGQAMVLTATIYDELGDRGRAIEYFGRALDLGDLQPTVIRRQVILLFQEQRFDEADRVIGLLDEASIRESEILRRIWAEIKLLRQDFDKALELAEESAQKSEDYRDHVFLGRIYAAMAMRAREAEDRTKAETLAAASDKSLMKALQLNPTDPEPWVALVHMHAATGDRDKAQRLIEESKSKIEPGKLPTALAQMYDLAGDTAASESQLKTQLTENPNDPVVIKRAVEFYQRQNRPKEAMVMLERLIEGKGTEQADVVWARRRLGLILFESGGYQDFLQAVKLIDENLKVDPNSLFDRRIKARLLATRATRKQRQEAIAVLEDLLKGDQSGTAEDRFVLTRLYVAAGNSSKANEQMRQLLSSAGNNPVYLETFIRDLLKRREAREAGIWVDQLEKAAPDSFTTFELRARVLAEQERGQGDVDGAIKVLNDFLASPDGRPLDKTDRLLLVARTLGAIGSRLSEMGLAADADGEAAEAERCKREAERVNREAEGMYRRYVQAKPEQELLLGTFLAQQGQVDKAVEVLENGWRNANSRSLGAAVVTMIVGTGATDAQLSRVEAVLDKALDERDNAEALLLAKAELCILQGRDEDAEKLYSDVIQRNANNVVALNNLAVFLAHRRKDVDKALDMINKCIELAGPVSALLDSRGSVHLARGSWEAAIEDLEEAIADTPTAPRYFHLAEAHYGFQDTNAAIQALKDAHRLGLSKKDLRKAEVERYENLLRELRVKSDSR